MVVSFLVMSLIFSKTGESCFLRLQRTPDADKKQSRKCFVKHLRLQLYCNPANRSSPWGGINSLPTSIALHIRDSPADVLRRTSGKRHRNRFHFGGIPFRALRLPVPVRTRYFCQPRLYLPDLAIGRLKLLALPYPHAGKMSIPNFPLLQILRIFLHGRMGSCEILPQLSCMNIGYETAECKKGAGA